MMAPPRSKIIPRGHQEAPGGSRRPPRGLLFLRIPHLIHLTLIILLSFFPLVFPERFSQRLGEHVVQYLGQALAQRLATLAFPKAWGGGGSP